jgi:hypothetical protein
MRLIKKALLIFTLTLSFQLTLAQDDCEQTLRLALDEFNNGHFFGIASILKPCIEHGFTKEQRQRAYLLLTQTYLLTDDPIGAEDSYLRLLKANPEFTTDVARDPVDVVYLSKKFTSAPIFSLLAKIGPNISIPRIIRENNVFQGYDTVNYSKRYFLRPGWQFSIGTDLHVTDRLSVSLALQYAYTSYQSNYNQAFGRDKGTFIDKQTWLNVPLSIKYSFEKGRFNPFIFLGYSTNFMISDKANINSLDILNAGEASQPSGAQNLNILYKRNILNYAVFLGGGLRRKIGLNYIFADLRYSFGLRNMVKEQNLYTTTNNNGKYSQSQELIMRYGHIDDYLRLDNLSISVGYIHPLYKPRKLKKARTKSTLKEIRSQK